MTIVNQAIEAALQSDWEKAIDINFSILKNDANNIDALNRLAYAYLKTGEAKKAETSLKKVLRFDPFNPIALKNIKKIKNPCPSMGNSHPVSPKIFLEEPGITKIVNLINLAPRSVLSALVCGQPTKLIEKKHTVEIRTEDNIYIGALPDDLAFRIRKLVKMGNTYNAYVKCYDEKNLTIIIRETKRSKKVKDASFVVKLMPDYHTSIRSDLLEELIEDESTPSASEVSPDEEKDEEE